MIYRECSRDKGGGESGGRHGGTSGPGGGIYGGVVFLIFIYILKAGPGGPTGCVGRKGKTWGGRTRVFTSTRGLYYKIV